MPLNKETKPNQTRWLIILVIISSTIYIVTNSQEGITYGVVANVHDCGIVVKLDRTPSALIRWLLDKYP